MFLRLFHLFHRCTFLDSRARFYSILLTTFNELLLILRSEVLKIKIQSYLFPFQLICRLHKLSSRIGHPFSPFYYTLFCHPKKTGKYRFKFLQFFIFGIRTTCILGHSFFVHLVDCNINQNSQNLCFNQINEYWASFFECVFEILNLNFITLSA